MRGFVLRGAAIVVATLLTRLPVLLSATLALDGDDSILGLMAIHLLRHGRVALFFYGQHYGFSLIEVVSAAITFSLFGISDTSLRVAMLPLWCTGVLLFSLAARRAGGSRAGWVCAFLLITSPAWLIWSTRARGGYLTAFMFTGLLAFLSTDPRPHRWVSPAIGTSLGLVAMSQPTWLPAAVPFVLLSLRGGSRSRKALFVLTSTVVTAGLLFVAARLQGPAAWTPPIIQPDAPLAAFSRLPSRLWTMLSGQYYYWYPLPAGPATSASAWVWCGLVVAILAGTLTVLGRTGAAWACAAGIVATALLTLSMNNLYFGFRYLLPIPALVSMGTSLMMAWLLVGRTRRLIALVALATTAALGLGAAFEVGSYDRAQAPSGIPDRPGVQALVRHLLNERIHHVYCADENLQWAIMLASRDSVAARSFAARDRVPRYPAAVDSSLESGGRVGLVGWTAPGRALETYLASRGWSSQGLTYLGRFFVLEQPSRELLVENGFEIPSEGW